VPEGENSSHRRAGHFKALSDDVIETIIEHASNAPHEASGITMMYWHRPWCARPHENAFGFRRIGFEFWVYSYRCKASGQQKSWDLVEEFYRAMEPSSKVADEERDGVIAFDAHASCQPRSQ
jgi:hypothetical protein